MDTNSDTVTRTPSGTTPVTPALVGNRLVLVGAVLYLLEWVAIVAGRVGVPLGGDPSAHELLDAYAGHADGFGWAAGWFGVVLLGRVLLMVGLRSALTASGRRQPLMDLAVAAMAVSVALEVAAYTIPAGAAWAHLGQGSVDVLRALDATSYVINQTIFGPLGVSLLAAAVATGRSGLFRRTQVVLAAVSGCLFIAIGLVAVGPQFGGAWEGLSAGAAIAWAWMIWVGVTVWRARPALP